MTREEAIKMLANTKVYVDGKSRKIQEKLFSLGFHWTSGSKQVLFEDKPFIFIWKDMGICYSDDMAYFAEKSFREITAADILSIAIDEPEYRPFKNADECWEEMKKHEPFGWVKIKSSGYYMCISAVYDECICFGSNNQYYHKNTLDKYTFIDGTPFGIKED